MMVFLMDGIAINTRYVFRVDLTIWDEHNYNTCAVSLHKWQAEAESKRSLRVYVGGVKAFEVKPEFATKVYNALFPDAGNRKEEGETNDE